MTHLPAGMSFEIFLRLISVIPSSGGTVILKLNLGRPVSFGQRFVH